MSRNAIFAALFALADTVQWGSPAKRFITKSRRVKLFSDVDKRTQQPALYQAEHAETIGSTSNTPYKRLMRADWIIYFDAGEPSTSVVPTIIVNDILDAVEAAFAPKPADPGFFDSRNTLQGLVYRCYIDGEVFKDPGDIDGQAMLTVPIKLLVP